MKLKGYTDSRFNNFSGGMDSYNSPSEINDNAFTLLDNFSSEGNRLVSMKGNFYYSSTNSVNPVIGMTANNEDVFFIQGGKIYAKNPSDFSRDSLAWTSIGTANSTRYNMTSFYFGAIYVVVCDSLGIEDIRIYRFHKVWVNWIFTPHIITWLAWQLKAFTTCKFNNGRLFLGGLTTAPSLMQFSKTWDLWAASLTLDEWINFVTYDWGQQQIGDGSSPIVGFAIRQDSFYIFTKNSVWKITWVNDSGTIYNFVTNKETNTGAVGHYAICEIEQDIMFWDWTAVRRLSYESNGNTFSVKDVKISIKMDGFIQTLSPNQEDAVVIFDYPFLYTFLKSNTTLGTDVTNDTAIIYNVKSEAWTTSTGTYISSWCGYYNRYVRGIVGSSIWQAVIQMNEKGWEFAAIALSKEFSVYDNVDFKRYVQFEIEGLISTWGTTYIDLVCDWRVVQTRTIYGAELLIETTGTTVAGVMQAWWNWSSVSPNVRFIERFEMFNDCRRFQYIVRKTPNSYFEINTTSFRWKAVNAYPMHY